MARTLLIGAFVILGAAAGCGKDQSKADSTAKSALPATPGGSALNQTVKGATSAQDFQGTWDSGCDASGFADGGSQRVVYHVSGSDVFSTVQLFRDANCDVAEVMTKSTGKITFGAPRKDLIGAQEVDIKRTAVQATVSAASTIQSMQADLAEVPDVKCRAVLAALKVDVPVDFLACAPSLQEYTIWKIEDERLRLGDCESGPDLCKAPTARATELRLGGSFSRSDK
ncbi:MAG: hypothetical protein FJ146_16355 [Deltaproteobacteria bacterium]|nr:hypothetical protein [Deltaproteobacteria bacterium]